MKSSLHCTNLVCIYLAGWQIKNIRKYKHGFFSNHDSAPFPGNLIKGTSIHWNYKLFNYILGHKVMLCYTTMDFLKMSFFATTIYFRPAVNRFLNSKERYWSGNTLELVFSVGSALGDCNSQAVSWRVGGLLVIQVFSTCTRLKVSRNVHPSQKEKMIL